MKKAQGLHSIDRKLLIELSIVICVKVALIATICVVFFGSDTKVDQNAEEVSNGLLMRSTFINSLGEK